MRHRDGGHPGGACQPVGGAGPKIPIILRDGSEFTVGEELLASWYRFYPTLDVEDELRRAAAWSYANPSRRKSRRGINRFINSWLSRSQKDQARHNPQRADPETRVGLDTSGIRHEESYWASVRRKLGSPKAQRKGTL